MKGKLGIRRARGSLAQGNEGKGRFQVNGEGRLPLALAARFCLVGFPVGGSSLASLAHKAPGMEQPQSAAVFQLIDVPASAAHFSVNSQQCWAL
jgi:hypothetical protein